MDNINSVSIARNLLEFISEYSFIEGFTVGAGLALPSYKLRQVKVIYFSILPLLTYDAMIIRIS